MSHADLVFAVLALHGWVTASPVATSTDHGATPVAVDAAVTGAAECSWPPPPYKPCICTVPLPQSCNNTGWNYEIYENVNGPWSPGYPAFDPQYYGTAEPEYTGIADHLLNFNYTSSETTEIHPYGDSIPSDYWVIDYEGYVFACRSGKYKFVSYKVDDIALVWVGSKAITGWKRSNANLEQVYAYPPGQNFTGYPGEAPVSFEVEFKAGKYYPVRIMYGQGHAQAGFHLALFDPLGDYVIAPGKVSQNVFTKSCYGYTAQPFN